MRKKRILNEEHKRKISESLRGKKRKLSNEAIENIRKSSAKRKGIPTRPCSEETKERIRLATTGKSKKITKDNSGWFKKGIKPTCPFPKGNKPWNTGKKLSPEQIEKTASKLRGRKQTPEEIAKRSKSRTKAWDEYVKYDRHCAAIRRWSKEVRKRDNYICQYCFIGDKKMHAHHIKSWKEYPELRFDVNNGITLCIACHNKIHKKEI